MASGLLVLSPSVADPHHFDADRDPACHFDADPGPTLMRFRIHNTAFTSTYDNEEGDLVWTLITGTDECIRVLNGRGLFTHSPVWTRL